MSRTAFEKRSAAARAKGRETLSRAEVLAAAGRLLDESGVAGLSMRSLARALGTGPATLYWHVRDRDELLTGVLDETLRHIEIPPGGTWRERATGLAVATRAALLPRPALVAVLWRQGWHLGPVTLALADALVGLIAESGLPEDEVADAYLAVLWFVLGFVHAESQATPTTGPDADDRYPHLTRYRPDTDPAAADRRFTTGLSQLLAGIPDRKAPR
ncbi:TetR/AcrR family transcriptional regulator [Nocardia sp. NPDC057227]|uniref:TetR/AcrR family transcriptional regulator n=1 Tax=Nocardia sp. NPDC057227 TaxID=3346056 RepID=UPI00363A0B9F